MGLGERLKEIFNPSNWTDKAFLKGAAIKSMSTGFTNEYQTFTGPTYSLTPPDVLIGSRDYRGVDNPFTGNVASRNFLELFDCVPEIFAPIHAIASRIANADFQLRKYRNDQVVFDNEDWNRLYNTPNPLQHFRELIYEAVVYELVTGNEYMYFNTPSTLNKDYKNVMAIWNLPADQIEPVANSSLKLFQATTVDDIINRYKLDDKNFFETKDVLHIKAINLKWKDRKIKGRSPLLSADKAIANLIAVYEARNVIYVKRGPLGFVVSKKGDESGNIPLTKSERDRVKDDLLAPYGVTGNRSPIGITDVPVDFIKIGANISDLQPFEETLADAAAIYSALNVPFELAPKAKGETFANQATAERSMYENTVIPKANMYMQSLTNKLGLNEAKLYLHASFDHVSALQENKKEKAIVDKTNGDTYLQRFLNGIAPLNEWVISTGNDKVTADEIYDKRIYEMTPEQLARVKEVLSLKGVSLNNNADGTGQEPGAASEPK
jgi:HK97 family phage portal protein